MKRRSTTSGACAVTDFGLADLFGASFDGAVDARMMNSYLRLETDPATGKRHPLLAGLEDASRIINGVARVHTKPAPGYRNPPLTLIPSYPDLPMEEVFPRVAEDRHPRGVRARIRRRPRGLLPLGHRPHLLGSPGGGPLEAAAQRGGLGRQRAAPR